MDEPTSSSSSSKLKNSDEQQKWSATVFVSSSGIGNHLY